MLRRRQLTCRLLISLCLLYFIYNFTNDYENLSSGNVYLNTILNYTNDKTNVFFIESNYSKSLFDFKQECAIESAARHNPSASIYVITVKANANNKQIYQVHQNIHILKINITRLLHKTILHNWWYRSKYSQSDFKVVHLSDALRIFLLFKLGGIYMDLDTITIRNLDPITDYVGIGVFENDTELGNGFLHFKKHDPYLLFVLREFTNNYEPHYWDFNGPRLLQRLLLKYCDIENIKQLSLNEDLFINKKESIYEQRIEIEKHKSCNVSLYPYRLIYPIHWKQAEILFEHNSTLDKSIFSKTYSLHFFGAITGQNVIEKDENSIYEHFAKQNCPLSYKHYVG